jgi:hypothetical protein
VAQTVPLPYCGPFVVVRRPDRFFVVASIGRIWSIDIAEDEPFADWPNKKGGGITQDKPAAKPATPRLLEPESETTDPIRLVLAGTDPDDPGYAFTDRRWHEVKEPLEYHEFELDTPNPDDPLPVLLQAAREVRRGHTDMPASAKAKGVDQR